MIKQPLPTELLEKLKPLLVQIRNEATISDSLHGVMVMASMVAVVDELIVHRRELQKLMGVIAHNGASLSMEVTQQTLEDLGYVASK